MASSDAQFIPVKSISEFIDRFNRVQPWAKCDDSDDSKFSTDNFRCMDAEHRANFNFHTLDPVGNVYF